MARTPHWVSKGAPEVSLSALGRPSGVVFKIGDNGPGIPPAYRDRIFQPLFTTKVGGTGMGLSFARQVILSHGGLLQLAEESREGGAIFEVIV